MHQVGVLSEAVDYVLSDQMREKYALDVMFVTVGMIASITVALVLAATWPRRSRTRRCR